MDSSLTKADLITALKDSPVAGLRELIVTEGKDLSVTRVFPDPPPVAHMFDRSETLADLAALSSQLNPGENEAAR